MRRATAIVLASLLFGLGSCARSADEPLVIPTLVPRPGADVDVPPLPGLDPDLVAEGGVLYRSYCAECHGDELEGDPEWMRPTADGGFRPPPHDSSGHTWHHPDQLLIQIVLTGYGFDEPQSRMPTFGDRLDRDDVVAILEYIKSHWGREEREFQWEQTVRQAANE